MEDLVELLAIALFELFAVVEPEGLEIGGEFFGPPESGVEHWAEDGAAAGLVYSELVLEFRSLGLG